jgi:hypothetical protein
MTCPGRCAARSDALLSRGPHDELRLGRGSRLCGAAHWTMLCIARRALHRVRDTSVPFPWRDAPELCWIVRPSNIRGRRECRVHAAPSGLVCKAHKKTHTSIQGRRRQSGIPCTMALRLMPRSPWRRIRLVTIAGGLTILRDPVGPAKTSADLTPATGARTTRFCRTLQCRSSACWLFAHGAKARPANPDTPDAAASIASPPNVRDDGQRPSGGTGWRNQ